MRAPAVLLPALHVIDNRRLTRRDPAALALAAALFLLWLFLVILITSTHEYWRDEVRAWSLARQAASPLDLLHLIRSDGHPPLWYLLLYLGVNISNLPLGLPVVSLLVAAAAMALFTWRAPFPLWLKAIFLFTALPLYEYSVMARNYGLGMLLLFACAALYPSRGQRPWLLAAALALLANTSAHAAVLAGLLMAAWTLDALAEHKTLSPRLLGRRLYAPLALAVAGLAFSVYFTMPVENTILIRAPEATPIQTLAALLIALARPSLSFYQVLPWSPGALGDALIFLAVLGLLRRPPLFLAALGGQVGLGVLFLLVYVGYYRHQGLFLIFLLALYWIALETPDPHNAWVLDRQFTRRLLLAGQYLALTAILINGLVDAYEFVSRDVSRPASSSRYFGAFLNVNPELADAIILPEPDYRLESLPYYAANPIYLPRENRFSPTVSWTTDSQARLSLGELLTAARRLHLQTGRPVLIALGHFDLDSRAPGARGFSYNKVFTWTPAELEEFYRSTELVAEFTGAYSDEIYRVYRLRTE
jgi:hypothetical protein